jgi:septal ring factor EnvC (AmiA/AmiB activator)
MKESGFLIISFLFFISFYCYAQTSKTTLELKKKQVQQEIHELNRMLDQTRTHRKNSLNHLMLLTSKIEKRKEFIELIQNEIEQLQLKTIEVNRDIAYQKQRLSRLKSEYARILQSAQKHENIYVKMSYLFSAENIIQGFLRLKYISQYSDYRKKQAMLIQQEERKLLDRLIELNELIRQKNALLGTEMEEKTKMETEKEEKEQVVAQLQQKEEDLRKKLEERKREVAELKAAIQKIIAEELKKQEEERKKREAELAKLREKRKNEEVKNKKNKIKNNAKDDMSTKRNIEKEEALLLPDKEFVAVSQNFEDHRGKLPWPVLSGLLCEPYGEHEHPSIKGFMVVNNGIEICSAPGAEARAVFDGEVTRVSVSPTGGKLVIIRHGEYLTVYTHLENPAVKQGEKVKAGQKLGTMMADEEQIKSTMNFQLWKGQRTLNPAEWLNPIHQ